MKIPATVDATAAATAICSIRSKRSVQRCAMLPGVTNIAITREVEGEGFFYAPDPSSQLACMIAGNVAMNSGGAHCLKYGDTANNLLGLTLVTVEGDVLFCCNAKVKVTALPEEGEVDFAGMWRGSSWQGLRDIVRSGRYFPGCDQCGKFKQNVKW